MPKTVAQFLSSLVTARQNCVASGNPEWEQKHEAHILSIVRDFLPSGSGYDNGVKIDLEESTGSKLVFTFSFHHMDSDGYYCGWTDHKAVVTPEFEGFDVRVTGKGKKDDREEMADVFHLALSEEIPEEYFSARAAE